MFGNQGVSGCKRLAAAFIASGAALLSLPTHALTVTLSGATGNTCTYTNIAVAPGGDVTVTCSGGAAVPGTLAFSSANYSVEAGASVNAAITRTGGSSGTVGATVTASGACTVPNGAVSMGAGVTSATVAVTGGGTPGSCTLTLGSATGGADIGGQSSATVTVNAPNPGTIEFSAASYSFTTGSNGNIVLVNRVGGTSGAASATVSLSGAGCSLAAGSSAPVSWTAGSNTPAQVQVNAGGSAGACMLTVGGFVGAAAGTTLSTTVNVVAPAAGSCPNNAMEGNFGGEGQWQQPLLSSGQIFSVPLVTPLPAGVLGGVVTMSQTAITPSPVTIEVAISQTRCDFDYGRNNQIRYGTLTPCYQTTTNSSGLDIRWHTEVATHYAYCHTPPATGPWYFNIRLTYPSCVWGQCGLSVQWNRP